MQLLLLHVIVFLGVVRLLLLGVVLLLMLLLVLLRRCSRVELRQDANCLLDCLLWGNGARLTGTALRTGERILRILLLVLLRVRALMRVRLGLSLGVVAGAVFVRLRADIVITSGVVPICIVIGDWRVRLLVVVWRGAVRVGSRLLLLVLRGLLHGEGVVRMWLLFDNLCRRGQHERRQGWLAHRMVGVLPRGLLLLHR